jgi:hypothetical protein
MVSYSQCRYSRYNKQCLNLFWYCSLDYQIYQRQVREFIHITICIVDCVAPCVVQYGQCGGLQYSGSTQCCAPSTCVYSNDWYSQCLTASTESIASSSSTTQSAGGIEIVFFSRYRSSITF